MLKNILSIILVFSILAAGVPVVQHHPNAQGQPLDLEDSIRAVENLARTTGNPSAFDTGFGQAVTTLLAAAGLTQTISAQDDDGFQGVQTLNNLYLMAQASSPGPDGGTASFIDPHLAYSSTIPTPPMRPPRIA